MNTDDLAMHVRKLLPEEHGRTRALWEAVFTDDSATFLDYYYEYKTADNEIYIAEEETEIRSMLQLNPYKVNAGHRSVKANYIIAVATDLRYRKRGLMAKLLHTAMRNMYGRKEPFTFLMPAAEAIYYPFDFRFVYSQPQTEWSHISVRREVTAAEKKITVTVADPNESGEIAELAQKCLSRTYQVYAVRDAHYYQVRLAELKSENGGMLLVREHGIVKACCAYTTAGGIEIMEPLAVNGYEEILKCAVFETIGQNAEIVKVLACDGAEAEWKKPMIMVRILHVETMLGCLRAEKGLDCRICIKDPILTDNNKRIRLFEKDGQVQVAQVNGTACDGEVTIAALTCIIFGTTGFAQIREKEPGNHISEQLELQLNKIVPFQKVFLNEIV